MSTILDPATNQYFHAFQLDQICFIQFEFFDTLSKSVHKNLTNHNAEGILTVARIVLYVRYMNINFIKAVVYEPIWGSMGHHVHFNA